MVIFLYDIKYPLNKVF